ncbi:MAG: glutamate racemase [Lachnospiraceae bacterium]|nr:glutamate racemase [Lachnospiraceae bacterium]
MSYINQAGDYKDYIGVFDSGVGGISTLKELVHILPNEKFLYYGDSANAPYGEKTTEQVLALVMNIVHYLVEQRVKAIVIACNTATSVAVAKVRAAYPKLPVIGVEPAIKPAAAAKEHARVLVMATPITLHLEKYQQLSKTLEEKAEFIPVNCAGLAHRIERGDLEAEDLQQMLEKLLRPFVGKIDSVVLGCTHYPFVKQQIQKILGEVPMFDGSVGTAQELKRQLQKHGLCAESGVGEVVFQSSKNTPEELALYRWFYEQDNK